MDFMKTVMEQEPETGMLPPTTCEKTAKLGDVIEMLAKKTLPRIHIVDKSNQLVGVVTLCDIIRCFVSEPRITLMITLGECSRRPYSKPIEASDLNAESLC